MPAYPNLTPNLGKLSFDDIKDSLKTYLKNQDSLKDFNFEGSVMQTLINVLAYNTYYYAFYSNMTVNEIYLDSAQRIDSIVSLTKPLGYFVPLKTASRAVVDMFGLISDVPEYSQFRGANSDGIVYSFYTIKSYEISDSDALNVEIYEAKKIYKDVDVTPLFDGVKQRFFINDVNIDVSTLKVKVQLDGVATPSNTKDIWVLSDNFGTTPVANQNVYYLERANTGVYVLFGKTNSLGRAVDVNTDKVYMDYLSTSGSFANDISAFTFVDTDSIGSNLNLGLISKSQGGTDEPNIDLVKFSAPKLFGAQNRAVTKDDIKGLIASFFDSSDEFNVFGGDETFPQMFGRVFFTADLDPNDSADLEKIHRIYDVLKSKCVVTVTPEFTQPKNTTINSNVSFSFRSIRESILNSTQEQMVRNGIKTLLNSSYDTVGAYNYYFNAETAITDIKNTYADVIIDPSDFNITYTESFAAQGKLTINLENELDVPIFTDYEITNEFKNKPGQIIKLVAYRLASQNTFDFFNLKTLVKQTDGTFIASTVVNGRINIKKGIIEIYDNRQPASTVIVSVAFKNSYFRSKLGTKVKFRTSSVEIK